MEKNNKGYSLVEVIIVVAIIAAIGLTAMLSVSLIFNANARTCANDIAGAISECKIMTMTKGQGNVRLILYRDGENGNIFYELQTRESTSASWETNNDGAQKVGAGKCIVGSSDGANDLPDSPDTAWEIYFDRSTGALYTGTSSEIMDHGIYVVGGNRRYHIKIEKLTGKQTLEKY